MTRTKWLRLGVREPGDILRWAGAQSTRQLDEFRYRVIRGREYVSFRMVPRYPIEIGTNEIVVVAYVKPRARQLLFATGAARCRTMVQGVSAWLSAFKPQSAVSRPSQTAELYQFAALRRSSSARR
jgi:hypothetical protein